MQAKRQLLGALFLLLSGAFTPAALAQPYPQRIVEHDFASTVFGNTRKLRVLLPAGYDDPANLSRRYPVLYLNDGQNLFDASTAVFSSMEWQVDETVERLQREGKIEPLIVVGIDNAGRRERPREYLPYEDVFLSPKMPDPQGKKYPDFLLNEVLPFIGQRYRTDPRPSATGIGGSSYGALAALYAVVARPGEFGRLLLESPSVYVDENRILRETKGVKQWPARVYIGVGTNEGGRPNCDPKSTTEPDIVRDVRSLEAIVKQRSAAVRVIVEPCSVHNENAWAKRLPAAMQHLYPPKVSTPSR